MLTTMNMKTLPLKKNFNSTIRFNDFRIKFYKLKSLKNNNHRVLLIKNKK